MQLRFSFAEWVEAVFTRFFQEILVFLFVLVFFLMISPSFFVIQWILHSKSPWGFVTRMVNVPLRQEKERARADTGGTCSLALTVAFPSSEL